MAQSIPASFDDLLRGKRALAHLATLMPDGSPQVTPVCGQRIRINSARGRVKDKNMLRDPRVALSIVDPDSAFRFIMIRGEVVEITERGADAHIDLLAKKYLGVDSYPFRSSAEQRVIYVIAPPARS